MASTACVASTCTSRSSRALFVGVLAHIERWKLERVVGPTFTLDGVPGALGTVVSGPFFGKRCKRF
jgi:hypothetical protein